MLALMRCLLRPAPPSQKEGREDMKVGSLFSGGGLGDYGLELAGMEIAFQVEIDEYCQKILNLRWPNVPKWRDIRTVNTAELPTVDVISGGFPCQDISYANANATGIEGKRSGLWKEMFRIIGDLRPKYVLVENVPALLDRGMGVVLGDLAKIGYDASWKGVPASLFGANHRRDRVFIVAYPNSERFFRWPNFSKEVFAWEMERQRREEQLERLLQHTIQNGVSTRSGGRIHDGIANRVDRLKLLGNGQVVQVIQWIGERIMEFEFAQPPKETNQPN